MTLGWIANILIFGAMYLIGCKKKSGWVLSFIGNVLWCIYAVQLTMWDMFAVDAIAVGLAIVNYWKWRKQ
jgi:hypothetical protein